MEGKKQAGSSSSSFPSDLFGYKDSQQPASSSGVFASLFPPASTVLGRNSSSSELMGSWQKQPSGNQEWNTKKGTSAKSGEVVGSSISIKDRSSIFREEIVEPCHLSSSLYYGGQDIYSYSPSTQTSGSYPIFKKEGEEDDLNGNNSHSASRGNWWQGSLYY